MAWERKKSSAIDRRLDDLRREMSRLDREMRTANRAGARPPPATPVAPRAPAEDLFSQVNKTPGAPPAAPAPAVSPAPAAEPPFRAGKPSARFGRERFANYFMAGHFQDMRPSRQEMRVLRNKAILMLVLVLLLVFWLFYFYGVH